MVLEPGETVLDLGSGAGFDCFLAARAVGETGRVVGVDMTHEMLRKARANAAQGGYTHVELSELMGVPLGTVKGRMRIGLQKMRRALERTR